MIYEQLRTKNPLFITRCQHFIKIGNQLKKHYELWLYWCCSFFMLLRDVNLNGYGHGAFTA